MAEKETLDMVDNDIQETASADTLQPGAGSGGTESRAEMTAAFVQLLNQLGKEDLSGLFYRTLEQIGHEADQVPATADQNRATIAAKTVKEDIDDMFSDDELSEELREKAAVVFEAAVNTRMALETSRLEEEFEEAVAELQEAHEVALQEQANSIFEDLSEKIDQYMNYCVEQWMEDNQLAVESSLRTQIAENFMFGLQNLFAEHYISVPEEQLDVLGEMKAQMDEMQSALNEAIDRNLELESVISEATKEATIDEVSEGLAATQVEKLRALAEGIEYSDGENYRRKLEIVKEQYFTKKSAARSTGLITEEIDGEVEGEAPRYAAPQIGKYVEAISKSVK
jgi:hypothetical protein